MSSHLGVEVHRQRMWGLVHVGGGKHWTMRPCVGSNYLFVESARTFATSILAACVGLVV
jgi:hypothetical protein